MASIVTDVLKNSGLLEKEDLSTRIGKLASRIDETKAEVYSTVQDKYVDFKPNLNKTLDLSGRVKVLATDTQSLANKIKGEISSQLNSSTSDLHDLTHQMEKTNALIDMLHILCQVQEDLEQFEKTLDAQDFLQASKHVDNTRQNVALLKKGGYCDLKIVKALEAERCIHHQTLIYHLEEMWTATLKWNLPPAKETLNAKNVSQIRLTIGHNTNLPSAMQAMEQVGILTPKLKAFGKKLVEFIVTPLITFGGCGFNTGKTDEESEIVLRCKKSSSGQDHNEPMVVYSNLKVLLGFMKSPLLDTVVQSQQENVKISTLLGCLIWKDIADLLISKCLVHSIPTTSSQLEKYKAVIEATQEFEKYLQQIGFIHELTSPLLSYARNVNLHFANRKCQEITIKARELMKKELHNTLFVGTEEKIVEDKEEEDEKSDSSKEDAKQNSEANSQQQHLGDVLRFPYCAVSESVQQLSTLAYETLQDAVTDTPQCAIQLFFTVRNMFELFCDIVPTYHRDSIEKLAQVSAIHHNNCMLIAHYLMTLGHQYRQSLPPPLSQGAASFVDLIPVFRKLASECFLAQMRTQRSLLIESLSEAATFDRVAEENNKNVTEKAIKKTVHQLKHLQRVWGTVLPSHVYTKAMATLANTVLIHIVEKITALEDISADDAHTLYSLLSVLSVELPSIVRPKPDSQTGGGIVETQVETWMSFKELLFILEASLQDIVDRWADGKGPLALAFSSTEVKSMIRALFQNTDRRATALSKIKKS
ncbi:centromere/kinetochore protein zw10 homolog [Amphiura filiformis]|uniref:centromere/kinetochore protein zw10 homolog n=1 Tax=Amphiura filiformis TaxID=82378 RepID=UPI003B21713D